MTKILISCSEVEKWRLRPLFLLRSQNMAISWPSGPGQGGVLEDLEKTWKTDFFCDFRNRPKGEKRGPGPTSFPPRTGDSALFWRRYAPFRSLFWVV